jgi:hypothetical protein
MHLKLVECSATRHQLIVAFHWVRRDRSRASAAQAEVDALSDLACYRWSCIDEPSKLHSLDKPAAVLVMANGPTAIIESPEPLPFYQHLGRPGRVLLHVGNHAAHPIDLRPEPPIPSIPTGAIVGAIGGVGAKVDDTTQAITGVGTGIGSINTAVGALGNAAAAAKTTLANVNATVEAINEALGGTPPPPQSPGTPTVAAGTSPGGPDTRHDGKHIRGAIEDVGHAIRNLTKFPVMTDDVSGQVDSSPSSTSGPSAGGVAAIGRLADRAIQSVLNWKPKDDPQGFTAALARTFTLKEFEGHTIWIVNTPGTTTPMDVTADLSGAQRSLYTRARDIIDASSRIIKTVYSLSATTDPQDADALTALVSDLMGQIPAELGFYGGPRPLRVDMLFDQLLGPLKETSSSKPIPPNVRYPVQTDPDFVGGALGQLRAIFGLSMNDGFVNTLDEEQNQTNYRIVADYLISLRQSWEANRQFFLSPSQQLLPAASNKFLGTQIVLITRQLQVVWEAVEEIRFALDSVFVGRDARAALEIDRIDGSSFFLEDILSWIYDFSTVQGQQILQEGGKLAVQTVFRPTAEQLRSLARELVETEPRVPTPVGKRDYKWDADSLPTDGQPRPNKDIPEGFFAPRTRQALINLHQQLDELVRLSAGIIYNPVYAKTGTSVPTVS